MGFRFSSRAKKWAAAATAAATAGAFLISHFHMQMRREGEDMVTKWLSFSLPRSFIPEQEESGKDSATLFAHCFLI